MNGAAGESETQERKMIVKREIISQISMAGPLCTRTQQPAHVDHIIHTVLRYQLYN